MICSKIFKLSILIEILWRLSGFSGQENLKEYRNALIPHLFITGNSKNEEQIKHCSITPLREMVFKKIDAFFEKNDIERIDVRKINFLFKFN